MEQHRSPTRRLRIFLRDFRLVEAAVHLAGGQSLAAFFMNRKMYLNLREAFWTWLRVAGELPSALLPYSPGHLDALPQYHLHDQIHDQLSRGVAGSTVAAMAAPR